MLHTLLRLTRSVGLVLLAYAIKLRWLLDLRTHSHQSRVLEIAEGACVHEGDKYLIFVLNSLDAIPSYHRCVLEAAQRLRVNVIVASHIPYQGENRAYLLRNCHTLLIRKNIGRDFGGYKDAILYLWRKKLPLASLILANDSVFYIPDQVDALICAALNCDGFFGVTEATHGPYHVQSYFVGFGPEVLPSNAFRRFWTRYCPINTRYHAIQLGEFGLSKAIIKGRFAPTLAYSAVHLHQQLCRLPLSELVPEFRHLPKHPRRAIFAAVNGNPRLPPEILLNFVRSELLTIFSNENHTTGLGFLFSRFGGFPVIKRDMVYRELYTLLEVTTFTETLDPEVRAEIIRDLRLRGSINNDTLGMFGSVKRKLIDVGLR
jgi:hypothetical protein